MGAALHRSGPHLALPTQGTQPSAHKQEPIQKGGQEASQGREGERFWKGLYAPEQARAQKGHGLECAQENPTLAC